MLSYDRDIFEFRKQFLKLAGGAFRIFDANEHLLLFSEQKAFKLREDIRVYTDERRMNEVLSIKTPQILDISATYEIVDTASQSKVGALKRKGIKSILRDEWEIYDPSGMLIGLIQEDSMVMALLRRFLTNLVPQVYSFVLGAETVGVFRQRFNPFVYRATMDLSSDRNRKLDRRIAVAAGILLMAIEGRQD